MKISNYHIYLKLPKNPRRSWIINLPDKINKFHYMLGNEQTWLNRPFEEEPIISKSFTPSNYKDVPLDFYPLVADLGIYFNCRILMYRIIPIDVNPINTFYIIGYEKDVNMLHHELNYIINGLLISRASLKEKFRKERIASRRKHGVTARRNGNAVERSTRYYKKAIWGIVNIIKTLKKDDKQYKAINRIKFYNVDRFIMKRYSNLDFKNYSKLNPSIKHAFSSLKTFKNKRLLIP